MNIDTLIALGNIYHDIKFRDKCTKEKTKVS